MRLIGNSTQAVGGERETAPYAGIGLRWIVLGLEGVTRTASRAGWVADRAHGHGVVVDSCRIPRMAAPAAAQHEPRLVRPFKGPVANRAGAHTARTADGVGSGHRMNQEGSLRVSAFRTSAITDNIWGLLLGVETAIDAFDHVKTD